MALIKYGENSGTINKNQPDYVCALADFSVATDKPDGSTLIVIDEGAHEVKGYYVAFGGFWNRL